jgi:hypothetical protein
VVAAALVATVRRVRFLRATRLLVRVLVRVLVRERVRGSGDFAFVGA